LGIGDWGFGDLGIWGFCIATIYSGPESLNAGYSRRQSSSLADLRKPHCHLRRFAFQSYSEPIE
jgi:hypothetical protein